VFAGVVGLGALLLFQVQLVLGKRLLPWFGGASAVWTTCLLFYQTALLAGYGWAHLVVGRLSPRRQRDAHLALVVAALALLCWRALTWPSPITPGEAPASAGAAPILSILGLAFYTDTRITAWYLAPFSGSATPAAARRVTRIEESPG